MQKLHTFFVGFMIVLVSGFVSVSSTVADEVFNNVDATIDTSIEVLNLTTGGANGSVTYKVHVQPGDGDSGCNLDSGEHLTLNVTSGNPVAATVSPAIITFNGPGCGESQVITVTPVAVGDSTVSLSIVSNTTGAGSFNLTTATFTAHVTAGVPSDITPPVIVPSVSPAANANGWHNGDVTVSWTVSDDESPISSSTGCEETVLSGETAGTILTCTATSAGGTSSESVTIKIDTTAPVISGSRLPLANANGWNNTDVAVSFACADTGSVQSGIDTDTVVGDTLTAEGADQSVTNTGACVDRAGNTADSATVSGISIDKTAPVVIITNPVDGAHYIRTHTVLADWSVSDALSDIDGSPSSTTADGAPIDTATVGTKYYSVSAEDLAGNSSSVTVSYIVELYTFGGWGSPLTLNLKDFKKTSTIPVKIKLTTSDSVSVPDAVAHLSVGKTPATLVPAISSGSSNVGDLFRYDPSATQYIFNLTTRVLPSVGTYTLRVTLDDGTQHDLSVVIR